MTTPMAELLEMLAEVYRPEGVAIWLHAKNQSLGGRVPVDMIEAGEIESVLQVVEQLVTGAFG